MKRIAHNRNPDSPQPIFSPEDADLSLLWWGTDWKGYPNREFPRINGKRTVSYAHRLIAERILGRKPTRKEIADHIEGNIMDCRRDKIRVVTNKQNCENKHRCGQFRGTYWHKRANKWLAQVKHNYKAIYIGLFINREDAANAAKIKREELGFLTNTP